MAPFLKSSAAVATITSCESEPRITPFKARPERAVSLRQVSEVLASGRLARLEGLTRLDGYITDKENRDIILWGLAERGQPELELQDFVVALRWANGRYAVRRDGIDYIANPLISIDPDVAVLRELRAIDLFSSDGEQRQTKLCKSPQIVRIEGMPRNSRVAKVLVDADYRMKMVSQGIITLPISSPFESSFGVQVERWREEAGEGDRSRAFNTRYWFHPGRFTYEASEDADTTFLDCAQVILSDEDQLFKGASLVASGEINDISRAFTCAWTDRMDDIYKAEPIWRDMHNIFRHFAVARIMRDRDAFRAVGFASEFLLDSYELPHVNVTDTLPGVGRIVRQSDPGRPNARLAYQVCGGVSVGFDKPLNKTEDGGETRAAGRSVLTARPDVTAVAWTVTPGALRGIFDRQKPKLPAGSPSPGKAPSLKDLFKS